MFFSRNNIFLSMFCMCFIFQACLPNIKKKVQKNVIAKKTVLTLSVFAILSSLFLTDYIFCNKHTNVCGDNKNEGKVKSVLNIEDKLLSLSKKITEPEKNIFYWDKNEIIPHVESKIPEAGDEEVQNIIEGEQKKPLEKKKRKKRYRKVVKSNYNLRNTPARKATKLGKKIYKDSLKRRYKKRV